MESRLDSVVEIYVVCKTIHRSLLKIKFSIPFFQNILKPVTIAWIMICLKTHFLLFFQVFVVPSKAEKCGNEKYRCPVKDCSFRSVEGSRVFISKHFTNVHKDYRSWRDIHLNKDAPRYVIVNEVENETTAVEANQISNNEEEDAPADHIDPENEAAGVDDEEEAESVTSEEVGEIQSVSNESDTSGVRPDQPVLSNLVQPVWTQANQPPLCATSKVPIPATDEVISTIQQRPLLPNTVIEQPTLSYSSCPIIQQPSVLPGNHVPMALVPLHHLTQGQLLQNPISSNFVPPSAPLVYQMPPPTPIPTGEVQKYKIVQVMVPIKSGPAAVPQLTNQARPIQILPMDSAGSVDPACQPLPCLPVMSSLGNQNNVPPSQPVIRQTPESQILATGGSFLQQSTSSSSFVPSVSQFLHPSAQGISQQTQNSSTMPHTAVLIPSYQV